MASHNWGNTRRNGTHTGKCTSRREAKARFRHNDKTRRGDPQVNHANLAIDKSRTHLNYELGPTAGLTYEEKCERFDARLDELGYADDGTQCMQCIITYPPKELDDGAHPEELRRWFDETAKLITEFVGEENVMGMYVDADEVREYTSALPGEEGTTRRSRIHMHTDVVNACEYTPNVGKRAYYLTPSGEQTLDESEAATEEVRTPRRKRDERGHAVREEGPDGNLAPVYVTPDGGDTFDVAEAAVDVKTVPVYARYKSKTPGKKGSIKYAPPEEKPAKRYGLTSRFQTKPRMQALNKMTEEMTREKFNGLQWMEKEPDDPTPERTRPDYTVEELTEQTLALVAGEQLAKAQGVIADRLARSEALLDEAVAKHGTATRERDGYVVLDRDGARETRTFNTPEDGDLAAFGDRMDRMFRVGGPGPEGSTVVEVQHAPRVVAARTKRDAKQDAKRVREAAEADAKRVREEAARNAQAVYDDALAEAHLALVEEREGDELEAAHERHVLALKRADVAEREQLLDERVALVNERSDDVRRREDAVAEREAEATRLLDGYEREATIADFTPELPPDADEGERAAADERARKAFAGACFHNGLKPPTVHVPGVRERDAELTRQEQELVPLLKAVRAFIADPVTFVADALRRVQGYIAEVAHSEGTTRSQRLTNEMMNDAIADATRLMYAHPGDPRMREACAPDAPALREDERSGPVFDVDAWAEERRRKRAAKSAAKMTRQTLQQRLTQQPEQQSVREVWPESYAPKPRRGHDGPEL